MLAQADVARIPLSNKSIHCIVTSPPYWGLRKYAGDQGTEPLGLEPTPERHIERTVQWAREVWRVLRDDGVFWLNYGDCFATGSSSDRKEGAEGRRENQAVDGKRRPLPEGTAAGNLMLMPHRIALALQADGWIVRQDLVWSKPNPMPESVNGWRWQRERTKSADQPDATDPKEDGVYSRAGANRVPNLLLGSHAGGQVANALKAEYEYGSDYELRRGSWRHTRSHEYVFMLVKGMQYWSDQEAVREALSPDTLTREAYGWNAAFVGRHQGSPTEKRPHSDDHDNFSNPSGRNPRSVLHIPTSPYKGAHYATYPPMLIAPLILAACPRWCCPVCGQGWAPVVDSHRVMRHELPTDHLDYRPNRYTRKAGGNDEYSHGGAQAFREANVLGYRPTCEHPHTQEEAVPGTVLDPFVGSGTTVMVARQLLRRGIGLDISRLYLDEQAKIRAELGSPKNSLSGLPMLELLNGDLED